MHETTFPAAGSVVLLGIAGYTGEICLAILGIIVATLSIWSSIENIRLRRLQRRDLEARNHE